MSRVAADAYTGSAVLLCDQAIDRHCFFSRRIAEPYQAQVRFKDEVTQVRLLLL